MWKYYLKWAGLVYATAQREVGTLPTGLGPTDIQFLFLWVSDASAIVMPTSLSGQSNYSQPQPLYGFHEQVKDMLPSTFPSHL